MFNKVQPTFENTLSAEEWRDLLEPEFYPDPGSFRASLQKITKDENELKKNLASNKATLRVLAPYLKIIHKKEKERLMQSARDHKVAKRTRDPIILDSKLKEQLLSVVPDISEKFEMIESIHETADVLKSLLRASNVVSYIVNPSKNELYQSPRHVVSSSSGLTWKIEPGSTIAAYAAFTKEHVTSNNVQADLRFPRGLGFTGSLVKYALCVPIKTPDDKVVAVYEIVRDAFDVDYDTRDVQLVLALTSWMGVAILQNTLNTSMAREHELTTYLLELTNQCHSGQEHVDKTLKDFVIFARENIGAERCNLYVVEKKSKGSLIVEEYDQGSDNSRELFKRRTKKHIDPDNSTLSKVMFNKEIVNKHQLITEVHLESQSVARSVLCVPILSGSDIIGAIQLTNKHTEAQFSKKDEETLKEFATFCAISLNHLKVHERLKTSEMLNNVNFEMLAHHIKPCAHEQELVKKCSLNDLPDEFFTLAWYPSPDHMPKLVELTIKMFHEVLGNSFMALNNIPKFVITVQNCYRQNPYHNFLHAFVVMHTMSNIIYQYHNIFNGIERKALLVAALCHDLDHRGYTNNFVQLTGHYLSSLYDSSPLENHHFAVTKMILQQCGMFRYIKHELYNELMAEIYECIIATDLSLYFQCRMELMRVADERTFTFKDPSHRRLLKSLMMTASDLSGQTKSFPICKKITEDVYEEFYQQGDIEKKMGFIPLPTMDRDKKDMIAENQVQFLTVVVLPCVETVSRIFDNLKPLVWDCRILLKQWKDLIEVKDQDTWKPEESVPK